MRASCSTRPVALGRARALVPGRQHGHVINHSAGWRPKPIGSFSPVMHQSQKRTSSVLQRRSGTLVKAASNQQSEDMVSKSDNSFRRSLWTFIDIIAIFGLVALVPRTAWLAPRMLMQHGHPSKHTHVAMQPYKREGSDFSCAYLALYAPVQVYWGCTAGVVWDWRDYVCLGPAHCTACGVPRRGPEPGRTHRRGAQEKWCTDLEVDGLAWQLV